MPSKLPKKYFHLVFSLLMGATVVFIVTFSVTLLNFGPRVADVLAHWPKTFVVAYSVAVPVIYFLAPQVRRLTLRLVETPGL